MIFYKTLAVIVVVVGLCGCFRSVEDVVVRGEGGICDSDIPDKKSDRTGCQSRLSDCDIWRRSYLVGTCDSREHMSCHVNWNEYEDQYDRICGSTGFF